MRKISLCYSLCILILLDTVNANDMTDPNGPMVTSKISQETINKALAPDGFKGIMGILTGSQKFESSVEGIDESATKSIRPFALTVGIEYAKSFKNKFFLAINLLGDIGNKKKKEESWQEINPGFNKAIGGNANKSVKLENERLTPSLGIKAGYWFRKWKSVAYLKLGISKLGGKYTYYLNENKVDTINANCFATNLAIGGEYRINTKLGAGGEIGFPIGKKTHKKTTVNGIRHQAKLSRFEIRIFGVYTISKPDSLPNSLSDFVK
ncbi:MAG: hypothetical protein IJ730_06520 [Alphaproteobacteria bacterium]|nr:hypothetical protein [Alphaproteobacteria bacterium]